MKVLFIIEAPFQLLSAIEAINEFSIKHYKIIVRLSGNKNNDEQLKKLISKIFQNFQNFQFLTILSINKSFKDYCRMIYFILKIIVIQKRFRYIFIGNMESGFLSTLMKFIDKNKIFLLDDGIKSISFQLKFNKNKFYNLFTMLDNLEPIENQIIIYNKFSYLQSLISEIEYTNEIFFLGSKLSEIGIIKEEYYIDYIKKIIKYYNSSITYIAHRGEDTKKLDKLSNIGNMTIKILDYPIEMYPIFTNKLPRNIASFYSAALISMNYLYPKISIKSFYLNNIQNYENEILNTYKYIKNNINIEVIDLND